jgi:glycosyltransferase involved in cell wall biosynthesis
MRIAIDARALQEGFRDHAGRGIGRYAAELTEALARRSDVELELWFERGPALPAAPLPPRASVRWYAPAPLPPRRRLATLLSLPYAARTSRADVFHYLAHVDGPPRMPRHGIVTVHDLIPELFGERYRTGETFKSRVSHGFETMVLRSARALIAVSAVTRDDLVRVHGVDPARVHVVHHGLHERFRVQDAGTVAAVRERFGLRQPFVLYVGGIDERKNVRMLVEAFAHARSLGLPAATELVFAGRVESAAEYPALRERVRALGLEGVFRTPGFVADADLPALYAAAGVFAFPSLYEGFGFPPLEAMACGTPVVSTAGGALGEVLGEAAVLAPADDPRAFGAALAALPRDAAALAGRSAAGLAHAARFTWDRAAESTVQAYRDVVERRGPA